MRHLATRTPILTVLLLVTLSVATGHRRGPASEVIKSFRIRGVPLIDALLGLGQEQRVPLSIEYIDLKAVSDPISVDIGPASVGQILDAILQYDPGYSWSSHDGVICISHTGVPAGGANLLDHILSDFSIPKMSITHAALDLDRVLYMDLHPGTHGWAGSYAGEVSRTQVGPYTMRGVTVREVLNRMVKDAGDAAWVVQVPPGNLDRLPTSGLWRTIQYETPPKPYGPLFRGILLYTKPDQKPGSGS